MRLGNVRGFFDRVSGAPMRRIAAGILYVASASGQADGDAAPIYGIKIPSGCRDWRLISVKQLAGNNIEQLRAQLGNDIAIAAFRDGKVPFPDGSIIAALQDHGYVFTHYAPTP
jgi:hypothetical protein